VLDHKLSLTSTPGRGTSFIVEVPISTAVAVPLARSDTPARVPAPLDGLTVLCLDNEPAILDGMRILLTGWGCDVRTAGTIADALAELRELDAASVVLIADYHLDDGEGISAIAQMRALAGADVPAVLLTADRSAPVRQEATAANIQVLNKPVRPGALRATLTQWRMVRQAAE
jgi:CheY-like chemotaxis protein